VCFFCFPPSKPLQRRLHYAQQVAGAGKPPDGHPLGDAPPPPAQFPTPVELSEAQAQAAGQAFATADPNQPPPPPPQANDFRARFHRSLVAPSPFRTFVPPQPVAPADGIDPHLGAADQAPKTTPVVSAGTAIDPELGQARGEAEGVVGRLERG